MQWADQKGRPPGPGGPGGPGRPGGPPNIGPQQLSKMQQQQRK